MACAQCPAHARAEVSNILNQLWEINGLLESLWDAKAMNCWSCVVHQRMRKWWLRREWNDMKVSLHNLPDEPMNQWINEGVNYIQSMNQMIQWIKDWVSQCISQLTDDSMNLWVSEIVSWWIKKPVDQMNQWINAAVNQRMDDKSIIGSINQWTDGSMNQKLNELVSSWNNEPMKQWTGEWCSESLNPRVSKLNEWMSELMNQWTNGWTNEWLDGWASYVFVKLLLHWATSRWSTSSLSYFFSEKPLIWATSTLTLPTG